MKGVQHMSEIRGWIKSSLLVAIATFASAVLPAGEIPTASPEDMGVSSERLLEIDAVMQRHIEAGKIQGAVTVVARRGKVVHFKAHGLMDVERERAMEKDAIFRMASSSKPVLGVAAMMMIEEGLFKPTDQVAKYLPEFKDMKVAVLAEPADKDVSPEWVARGKVPEHRLVPAQRQITIHDLLTHTAGLGTYGLGIAVAEWPEPGPEDTLATMMPRYAAMPLDFQPGTRWAYSAGIGLDVVARIIEIVTEIPYEEFLRNRIFEPLGMTDTYFFLPQEKESRRVVIHGAKKKGWGKSKGWGLETHYASASGGLSSTAEDYLRFEQMLFHKGTLFGNRILKPESVATMSGNYVGDLYQGKGKRQGVGFGYTVEVVLDPAAAKSERGRGSFGWGGAYGTVSWTDPTEEITAVLLVQQPTKVVLSDFENAIRQAIIDSNAENPIIDSNAKSTFIGTWELTSDWGKGEGKGKHIISVNPDLTGTVKDLEQGWTSKLRNVESKGDELSFSFFYGETEEYEIEFEGTIVDKAIKGEFAIFGATAVVIGAPISAADAALAAARKSVADFYEARSFTSSEGDTLPYRLFVPEDYDPKKKYPVVLFHHGGGGTGNDNRRNLESACVKEWILPEAQAKNPCFIVVPQIPGKESKTSESKQAAVDAMKRRIRTIHEILDGLEKEFSFDKSREYVTGLSFGGECTWMSMIERPDRFAAAVPICATDWLVEMDVAERGRNFAQLPLWIFHGDADEVVAVETSRKIVKALRDAGGKPKYTEYPDVDHYSWDLAYRDPELIEWLFAQSRKPNQP
jgi:CubicO group peptidase (beta-lactamase class C family)/predicted esterase